MRIYKTFLVALCAFAFLACSQLSTPSPTEVFKTQSEAQKKKDVATMKQNLSKASLDLMENAAKAQNKTLDQLLAMDSPAGAQPDNYEIRNEKITGDTATIEVKAPPADQWVTMPFVKEDGKWKIALDKFMQDLMQQMSQQAVPPPAANTSTSTAGNSNTSTAAPAANKPAANK